MLNIIIIYVGSVLYILYIIYILFEKNLTWYRISFLAILLNVNTIVSRLNYKIWPPFDLTLFRGILERLERCISIQGRQSELSATCRHVVVSTFLDSPAQFIGCLVPYVRTECHICCVQPVFEQRIARLFDAD